MIRHYILYGLKWDIRAWVFIFIFLFFVTIALDQAMMSSKEFYLILFVGGLVGLFSPLYSVQGDMMAGDKKVFNFKYLYTIVENKHHLLLGNLLSSLLFSLVYLCVFLLVCYTKGLTFQPDDIQLMPSVLLFSAAIRLVTMQFLLSAAHKPASRNKQTILLWLITNMYSAVYYGISIAPWIVLFLLNSYFKLNMSTCVSFTLVLFIIIKYRFVAKLWDDESLSFLNIKRDAITLCIRLVATVVLFFTPVLVKFLTI